MTDEQAVAPLFSSDTSVRMSEERFSNAVESSNLLLGYAALQCKELEKKHIETIVSAIHGYNSGASLTPKREAEFWNAYHHVCSLINPVSRESLEATEPLRSSQYLTGNTKFVSKANSAVRRYQAMTIICLFTLLAFQI